MLKLNYFVIFGLTIIFGIFCFLSGFSFSCFNETLTFFEVLRVVSPCGVWVSGNIFLLLSLLNDILDGNKV